MEAVTKPTNVYFEKLTETTGTLIISPCYPGYGMTIGNSLRRVLLSSIPGSAITKVKFRGVEHEFSTVKGVKEDVIDIILNLKQARFKVHSDEPVKLSVKKKGKGTLTLADFPKDAEVEPINKDLVIATIADKESEVDMEVTVERGLGYVPVENREKDKLQLGEIAIDAVYTPIRMVSFKVENVRVGQRTDYDKVILNITTDGSINPRDAVQDSASILVEQFSGLQKVEEMPVEATETPVIEKAAAADNEGNLESLGLGTRTLNALHGAGVNTVAGLAEKTEKELLDLEGFGKTALSEVKEKLVAQGKSLKTE